MRALEVTAPVALKGVSQQTASPLGDRHADRCLYFPCCSPCGQPACAQGACPASRWLRTLTSLVCAVPQGPLGHHLQKSFEGKISNPKAATVAAGWHRLLGSASSAQLFIPCRVSTESGIPLAIFLGACTAVIGVGKWIFGRIVILINIDIPP